LVRPNDVYTAQQVSINLVFLVPRRRARLWVNRDEIHQFHQSSDAFDVDLMALVVQPLRHAHPSHVRVLEMLLVDQSHQSKVLWSFPSGFEVVRRTGQANEITLPTNAERRVSWFDHATQRISRTGSACGG